MDPKREHGERRQLAWIGQAILVRGEVVARGDLVIDGQVEGTIELGDHNLTIGESAAVVANLAARAVVISGMVTGSVTGSASVELKATGSIEGDVKSPRFVMEEGALLRGKVDVGVKKAPA